MSAPASHTLSPEPAQRPRRTQRTSRVSTAGLARLSARHPWRVLAAWLLVLVLAGFAATGLGDALTTEGDFTNEPDSIKAQDLLEARLRGTRPVTETVIIRSLAATVDDPAVRQVVEQTSADLVAMAGVVASATTYFEAQEAGSPMAAELVSADRHTTLIRVVLVGDLDEAHEHADAFLAVLARHPTADVQVLSVGDLSVHHAFTTTAEADLRQAEAFGLPVALIVLVVVFGAPVAAGVPLVLALVAIFVALGLTAVVGRFTDLSFYVVNMITMIGLAVGIDYALFIISRYREERRRGVAKLDAIELAGATASKAVLFSGGTVVLALAGLFLLPVTIFHSLGAGAVLVVIVAVAAMLTVVPALLGLLGDTIEWPRHRVATGASAGSAVDTGIWGRFARLVMARPARSAGLAVALLVVLALPYWDLTKGWAGAETLPPGDVKTSYGILTWDFYVGLLAPVEIVVDGSLADPTVAAGIDQLVTAMAQDPIFGPATVTPNSAGDLVLVAVPLKAADNTPQAYAAVNRLRNDLVPTAFAGAPARVYVGGEPAGNVDANSVIDAWTPRIFVFVLSLSFLLLLLAFRSIIVPAKAILMNLLSVGAAYGLMVLVFQKGYGNDSLGLQRTPTIEAWVPIFLFCVLFGLSMDYHVFLLSRIREHYDLTHDNREAVAVGLQSTAKIITGAALIMVIVFGAFATGDLVMFQQMGFGLAVAILLDATIVRSILVPATMALLGNANWYLPRWLSGLPDLRIEGVTATGDAYAPDVVSTPAKGTQARKVWDPSAP